jgi:hypothetical protein
MIFISAIRGTTSQFGSLLYSDFVSTNGQKSFLYWIVAITVIGGLGYIKSIRPLANAFLALLILVLFLSNKGVFAQFNSALNSVASGTAGTAPSNAAPAVPSAPSVNLGSLGMPDLTAPNMGSFFSSPSFYTPSNPVPNGHVSLSDPSFPSLN